MMDKKDVAAIDLVTLILLIFVGIYLGVIGFTGFDFIEWLKPGWRTPIYDIVGIGALWQFGRQRFF